MTATEQLIKHLSSFISDNRKKRLNEVIQFRTRYLTVVLEDIYQPHNASAVLRSCDCFGIQDVHIIENKNTYKVNPDVAMGAANWLSLYKYSGQENNTAFCLQALKEKGYKIVVTSPHENGHDIEQLPLNNKTALVFGTELKGISSEVEKYADAFVKIPMFGFTESFNISVSAALCLFSLTNKMRQLPFNWALTDDEKKEIMVSWLKNSVSKSDIIEREFLKTI